MKSNCISRKVGAVIEGKHGYLVGAGWNDVGEGQISCGLRKIKDLRLPEYNNCVEAIRKKGGNKAITSEEIIEKLIERYGNENNSFCLKDEISKVELQSKLSAIYDNYISDGNAGGEELHKKIEADLKVKRLEYCKALHAEENAIIQGAKIGGMGLRDSRIYITTYPCELCAKKIQQAGIREIIYVEPYPKVLSKDLYLKDGVRKVEIKQFEGVKANSYMKLFKSFMDQKDKQVLVHKEFCNNVV
jgi:deoxycytidylate deaminase